MKTGDKVIPVGASGTKPGTVGLVCGNKATVTWVMGSGWPWTATHDVKELQIETETCAECGGNGFAGNGTGYGDICDECAGSGEVLKI